MSTRSAEAAKRGAGRPQSTDRRTLQLAAIKLLREEGPNGLTVRRLTEVLGLSRQVVYTQYGSIGGLIDALYREGFSRLRESVERARTVPPGVDRVVAGCLAYREMATEWPELYRVMFERPFRDYSPTVESRRFALRSFEPLVIGIKETGRTKDEARTLAFSVWGAIHGLVHLELQGFFPSGYAVDLRIDEAVRALLDPDPR
jgi:AcrR family transcriptional regulator